MPVPLRDVITYAVGAVMALFAANQALHSSGMVSLYTLPALNPLIKGYLPVFSMQENEPQLPMPTLVSTPDLTRDYTGLVESTTAEDAFTPVESTTAEDEPPKHGTSTLVEPTTTTEDKLFKHGMFTPVDEADSPEDDETYATHGCSPLCEFLRTRQKILVKCSIISRIWNSFVLNNMEKIIDFTTQVPISAGLVLGYLLTLCMLKSNSRIPRVPIDRSFKDYGASDVYAELQEHAYQVEEKIAMAELKKLWNANNSLTADNASLQKQLQVQTQKASEQKSTVQSIRAALSAKTEEHCSAKRNLDDLNRSMNMLSLEKDKLSKQLQEKVDKCATTQTTLANTNLNLKDLQKTHTKLEIQRKQAIDTLATTNNDLNALRRDNTDLNKNLAEAERKLESTATNLAKAKTYLTNCERDKVQLNERLATEVSKLEEAKASLTNCEREKVHLNQQLADRETSYKEQVSLSQQLAQSSLTQGETLILVQKENGSLKMSLSEIRELLEKTKTDFQQQQAATLGQKSHLEGLYQKATAQVAELRLELAAKGDEMNKLAEGKDAELRIYRQKTTDLKAYIKKIKSEAIVAPNTDAAAPDTTSHDAVAPDTTSHDAVAPDTTSHDAADPSTPAKEADNPPDNGDEGEVDDNGKPPTSGPTKRRRKRRHAGVKPAPAPPSADADGDDPSAGQAVIVS